MLDVKMARFLLPLVAVALLVAGCQAGIGSPSAGPSATVGRPGTASIPLTSQTPGPAGVAFDAIRVNQVLGPAVAEIIVNTAQGVQLGSGFVVAHGSGTSYLVTNNHVVQGSRKVQVLMPDGRHFVADIQGTDPIEDIAVVKVADASLPAAEFADSTKLAVGEPVAAIGSPEGNESSLTVGVISSVHRTVTNISSGRGQPTETLPDAIQTDAAINPGNSGGPLADADGHVVGVNTADETGAQNIGYAIPSLVVKRIAEDLIAGRTPGHPYIGICFEDIADALAGTQFPDVKGYGIVVTGTVKGGPADRAGLARGDVVERIDSTDLNNGNTLGGVLQLHRPGDTVSFMLAKGSSVKITLGDRPSTFPSC